MNNFFPQNTQQQSQQLCAVSHRRLFPSSCPLALKTFTVLSVASVAIATTNNNFVEQDDDGLQQFDTDLFEQQQKQQKQQNLEDELLFDSSNNESDNESDTTFPLQMPIPRKNVSPYLQLLEINEEKKRNESLDICHQRTSSANSDLSDPEAFSSDGEEQLSEISQQQQLQQQNDNDKNSTEAKPKNGKKILVLDLDETLVRCHTRKASCGEAPPQHDVKTQIESNGVKFDLFIVFRPYLHEFLEQASQLFTLAVFTASAQSYADTLLKIIDPDEQYFDKALRFYRGACSKNGAKDLKKVTTNLHNVVLLDNTREAFAKQQRNGMLISSFLGNSDDHALVSLLPFLCSASSCADVRKVIKKYHNGTTLFTR